MASLRRHTRVLALLWMLALCLHVPTAAWAIVPGAQPAHAVAEAGDGVAVTPTAPAVETDCHGRHRHTVAVDPPPTPEPAPADPGAPVPQDCCSDPLGPCGCDDCDCGRIGGGSNPVLVIEALRVPHPAAPATPSMGRNAPSPTLSLSPPTPPPRPRSC